MLDRSALIDSFVQNHLGDQAIRQPLAADASFRRYERIVYGDSCFVLMDAPPPKEDVRPFCEITHWLRDEAQLHAPKLLAEDPENGILLLEDLGDDSFRKHIERSPVDEWPLYQAAIDALLTAQRAAALPAIAHYDREAYLRELTVFTQWYLPTIGKADHETKFLQRWQAILDNNELHQDCIVLRDFHADNLMWLSHESGLGRVGLLDYQDALIGDAAYDLVSLLEDARRDVSPQTMQKALDYYLEQSGQPREDFLRRYAILGAQRNLKIIGIFNRLNVRDGKPHYLPLLPRVWAHLQHDLEHPALSEIRSFIQAHCL